MQKLVARLEREGRILGEWSLEGAPLSMCLLDEATGQVVAVFGLSIPVLAPQSVVAVVPEIIHDLVAISEDDASDAELTEGARTEGLPLVFPMESSSEIPSILDEVMDEIFEDLGQPEEAPTSEVLQAGEEILLAPEPEKEVTEAGQDLMPEVTGRLPAGLSLSEASSFPLSEPEDRPTTVELHSFPTILPPPPDDEPKVESPVLLATQTLVPLEDGPARATHWQVPQEIRPEPVKFIPPPASPEDFDGGDTLVARPRFFGEPHERPTEVSEEPVESSIPELSLHDEGSYDEVPVLGAEAQVAAPAPEPAPASSPIKRLQGDDLTLPLPDDLDDPDDVELLTDDGEATEEKSRRSRNLANDQRKEPITGGGPVEVWIRQGGQWIPRGTMTAGQHFHAFGGMVQVDNRGGLIVTAGQRMTGNATLPSGDVLQVRTGQKAVNLPPGTSVTLWTGDMAFYVRSTVPADFNPGLTDELIDYQQPIRLTGSGSHQGGNRRG